ncbi:MAG: hypothetical protein ACYDHB_00965 [Candidatus Dormibacteria bacterium]
MMRIFLLIGLAGLVAFAAILLLAVLAVGPMPVLLGVVLVAVVAIHGHPVRSAARLLLGWR